MKLAILALTSISAVLAADWTTFQDPLEKAFTVEVPSGWTAKGGMYRLGYSDERAMVDLQSPDGKINVRLGDVAIPVYADPGQFHREGEVYDLGAQAQMTVARYRSGQQYAPLYAAARFKSVCPHLTPQSNGQTLSVPDYLPGEGPSEKATAGNAGQATYDCDGKTAAAYSKTNPMTGIWFVPALGSYIAPRNQAELASSVLTHVAQSMRFSPQWIAYQKKMDAEGLEYQKARQQARRRQISQQVAQFEMKMQAMKNQVSAFERRQAAQSAQVESFSRTLIGITPTIDPLGNPRDVWTGPKSGYWTDGLGRVINSDTSPGPGWKPMTPQQ